MFNLLVPYVGEYQASSETWIGSGERHGNTVDQMGADYTTNFTGGGTTFHYDSNSFLGTTYANAATTSDDPPNFVWVRRETDNGSAYRITNKTLTYYYVSASGAIVVQNTSGGAQGTGTGSQFTIQSAAYSVDGAWPVFNWTFYAFTQNYEETGLTNSTTTQTGTFNFTSEQTGSGSGDFPIKGGVVVPYTVATTFQWGGPVTQDTTVNHTVYTGTTSTLGIGTDTYTVPTTDIVNITINSTIGSDVTVAVSRATVATSAFFDPDNFYTSALVLIPQNDVGIEDVVWLYHPGVDVPDQATFFYTDLYHSINGELNFAVPPRFFYEYVMPQIDSGQAWVSWTNTFEVSGIDSDNVYTSIGNSTSTSYDTINSTTVAFDVTITITESSYFPEQLPMSMFTNEDTLVPTAVASNPLVSYSSSSNSGEDWASRTYVAYSRIPFTTLTDYRWFRENDGRWTTGSWTSPLDSVTTVSSITFDGDVYITEYNSFTFFGNGSGFDFAIGDITLTRSYDTLFELSQYPNYPLTQSAFKPYYNHGFQIQPRIANTDAVFSGVDCNFSITDFPGDFFLDVFAEPSLYAVQAPFALFYEDVTGGFTGFSAFGDYTFSFGSDTSDVGQIFVTHKLFEDSSETFTAFLGGLGGIVQTQITTGFGVLSRSDHSIAGGSPNAGGFQTVVLNGYLKTTDNDRGSGTDFFNGSFVMADDELSVFENTNALQIKANYTGGGNFIVFDVFQAHTDMLSPGQNPL